MKTKLLSLLLLAAMLITGIPVMAVSAAETAPAGEQDYDYYDLYVQDGLKALHTAFDVDDETIRATNDGNGKWLNRVEGGSNAVLGGGYWRTTANGGIGYDLYRGAADDANGTNYVDDPGTNTYGNTTYFQFGASDYAHEDFTVEYVAEYLPIYTRLTGETAVIGSKVVGEAYNFNEAGMTTTSGIRGAAVDILGYLGNFTGARDGRTEKSEIRGTVRWMAASYLHWDDCRPTDTSGKHHYNTLLSYVSGQEIFHKRGGIYTFAITADENTADGKNEATYTIFHDRVALRTNTIASYTIDRNNGKTYTNLDYTVDTTNNFRLSHCLPTDFYVVRMYHKVLNEAEQAQNHVVDVLEYYNLAVDKAKVTEKMEELAVLLAPAGFVKGKVEKAAEALKWQKAIDDMGKATVDGEGNYFDLYVLEELVALHTAFDANDTTIKATNDGNGMWLNRVEGGNSAVLGGNYWRTTANGGIGYDLYRGAADDANGTNYVDDPGTNTHGKDIFFKFGASAYAHEDFTVEYVAEYLPIYTRLTGETAVIGSKVVGEAYTFNEAGMTGTNGLYYESMVDTLGYLGNFAGVRDGKDGERGRVRWLAASYLHWNNCVTAKDPANGNNYYSNTALGYASTDEIFHKRGGIYTFAITADENTAGGKNEATYAIFHDRVMMRTSTTVMRSFIDINGKSYTNLDYTVDSTNDFILSRRLPTDFYVVRMYHKVLSVAEQAQNHAVDVLNYYNLTIDKTVARNNMSALSVMLADVGFEKDVALKDATARALQAKLNDKGYINYNYVTDGLTAFFSAQGDNANTVDLAKGTWTDLYAGNVATLKGSTWKMLDNGFLGFNLYRGQANADGTNYVDDAATNYYYWATNNTTARLELGLALLPKADFTIDYTAEYKPIYTLLTGTTADNITEDKIVGEALTFVPEGWKDELYGGGSRTAVDYIGYLSGWTAARDGKNAYGNSRGGLRYGVQNSPGYSNCTGVKHGLDLWSSADYRPRGVAYSYAFTRDENTENGNNSAVYQIIQDNVVLRTSTGANADVDFTVDDKGYFYLSDWVPTDFFALRIYNRVLSAEELMQNALVDKVAFYGITLPEGALGNADKMAVVDAALPTPSSSMSKQDIAANRLQFENAYAKLTSYVVDGLTAFFSTNELFGDNVDLANGTWTDFLGGNVATLKQSAHWALQDNGFIGFNLYRGQADADGSNYVDDVATNNFYNRDNPTRLQLDISLLPQGDYTVDYMAEYKPVYTLLTGTTTDTISEDKIVGEAYELNTPAKCLEHYWHGHSVEALGYLTGWACCRDTAEGTGRSGLRWHVDKKWGSNTTSNSSMGTEFSTEMADFRSRGVAHSFAITRDVNLAGGANEATYSIIQDTVALKSYTQNDTTKADFTVADPGRFYLSDDLPTDFFALRIYNRALSAEELMRNALVDKVTFYDIELPEGTLDDAEKMAAVNAKITAPSSSMDALEKAVLAIQIEAMLFDKPTSLHVTDGMTAFFSTLGVYASTVDLAAGTWTDLVGGSVATLMQKSYWHQNANGSVGFTLYRGMIDQNGVYNDSSSYNTYNKGAYLNFASNLLPVSSDYTVEYVAQYQPLMAVDASGNPVRETFETDNNGLTWSTQFYGWGPVDRLGYMSALTGIRDGYQSSGTMRGYVWWLFHRTTSWDYNSPTDDSGVRHYFTAMSPSTDADVFHKRGAAYTYTIMRDIDIEGEKNEAVYSLWHDGAFLKSATVAKVTYVKGGTETYNVDFKQGEPTSFFLSHNLPTDFYAVRVYNRALTVVEKVQNAAADRLSYYGIELSEEILNDTDALPYIYETIASFPLVKDLAEWHSTKLAIEPAIEKRLSEFDSAERHYVRDGLVALYTAFADKSDLDLTAGTWQNKVLSGYGAATIGSTAKWTERDMGFGFSQNISAYTTSDRNYPNTGIKLPDEFAQLEDFTVETMGLAEGYTNDDGSRHVSTKTMYYYKSSTFRFGLLYGSMFVTLKANSDGESLGVRWQLWHKGFVGGAPTSGEGINLGDEAGWRGTTDIPKADNPTPYIPVIMHVTKAEDSANVSYNIYYDGKETANKSKTVTKADYDVYNAVAMAGYNGNYPGIFSLYANMSATVYAIRVYNRTLTNAEMRQNRAADIINYYEVTIPEEVLASEEALALFYEHCNTTVTAFDYGEVARDAKRLELEDFVKTATVKVGENEEEISAIGGKYTLPSAWNGSAAIAWDVDGVSYTPGMTVTVANGSVLQPTVAVLPMLDSRVSVKLTNAADGAAMRFTATLMLGTYNAIQSLYGATSDITYGMLITPDAYVKGAGGVFTREAIRNFVLSQNADYTAFFVEVQSSAFYAVNGEILTIAGSLYKFSSVTKAKNPAFAAVPFIDVDTNRDGVVDFTIYGEYDGARSRKVKDTFAAAVQTGGFTDEQLNWLNATLAPFN